MSKYLKEMVDNINGIYKEFNNIIDDEYNEIIKRGHVPSMSYMVENQIAYYIINLLGKKSGYKCYIDFSISDKDGNSKYYRPDIIIIDQNGRVKYVFEIKSNMGWCRELTNEQVEHYKHIKNQLSNDNFPFKLKRIVRNIDDPRYKSNYEFFPQDKNETFYGNKNVKYMFISFSILNISSNKDSRDKKIRKNYNKLKKAGLNMFFLTQSWYQEYENWELKKEDIEYKNISDLDIFPEDLEKIINSN